MKREDLKAEEEKLRAAANSAMVRYFNTARNQIHPSWAKMVAERYAGSVYEREYAARKTEADLIPGEIQIVIGDAMLIVNMNIGTCIEFDNPLIFDKIIRHVSNSKDIKGRSEEWNDLDRLKKRLVIEGCKAAKAAYLQLHPEHDSHRR